MNFFGILEMDKMDSMLFIGITAFALGISIFVLWGPKSRRKRNGNCNLMGLQNLGLTCFLNSLLQALAACPSFLEWLRPREENGTVSYYLYNTLRMLCYEKHPGSTRSVLSPVELVYCLRGKNWPAFPQEQDPHELFLHLISAVEEEEQKAKPQRSKSLMDALDSDGESPDCVAKQTNHRDGPSNRKPPMKLDEHLPTASPFRGYLASQLSCLRCDHKSAVVYDKFDTLSLPLPMKTNSPLRLSKLLTDFVSAELVDGFSCDICSPAQGPTQAMKAIKIGKLPKCLCLHISRTMMDTSGFMYKRENYVEIPELLPMADYTHTSHMMKERKKKITKENGSVNSVISEPKGSDVSGADLDSLSNRIPVSESLEFITPILNNNNPLSPLKGPFYKLRAVIEHRGSVDSGHFVTYRRGPIDSYGQDSLFSRSRWYYTSDDIVKKTSLSDVTSSSAYLLFYEKCVGSCLIDPPVTV